MGIALQMEMAEQDLPDGRHLTFISFPNGRPPYSFSERRPDGNYGRCGIGFGFEGTFTEYQADVRKRLDGV